MNYEQRKAIPDWIKGERRKIREQGIAHIHQLVDLGVVGKIIKEPIDISTGLLSAVFDIETSEGRKIVKFREYGILAEASAYIEWAQENVPVPRVLKASQAYDLGFGYLIMEPVLTDGGNLAPTGASITEDRRDEIEKFLGTNLAMMHKVKGNYFGNILDQNPHVQFSSWSEYVSDQLAALEPQLQRQIDLASSQLEALRGLAAIEYPSEAVYGHGDFGIHNVLVAKLAPFIGVIFDPNPFFADPYYDVAYYLNLKEAWGRKKIDVKSDSFLQAYFKEDLGNIDLKRLAAQRTFTAIYRVLSTTERREFARAGIYKDILTEQLSIATS